jgi:hypothetical protein
MMVCIAFGGFLPASQHASLSKVIDWATGE